MRTNIAGMASNASKPSNTALSLAKVASRSNHGSERITNMSDVDAASARSRSRTEAGESLPAPKKSA